VACQLLYKKGRNSVERKIIHVDIDAFFASVEELDNPKLKGKPIIVGGIRGRGVVSTCSYEARKYGIHSAMPTYIARQKCPHGIFLPPRHHRYEEVSRKVFRILYGFTPLVETVSIDEAYLDISNLKGNPLDLALRIKERILKETGLTVSVGISYNKFLAKIASDWNKPNGIKIINKEMVPEILKPLPIRKVQGIGEKSAKKLNEIGIFTIGDLLKLPKEFLIDFFGKYGLEIYDRIRGIDNREVITKREVKSIGRETTLKSDTRDKEFLFEIIKEFAMDIHDSIKRKNIAGKTVTIKYKTFDFEGHTKSKTLKDYISSFEDIMATAKEILEEIEFQKDVRLIGLSLSNFTDNQVRQLSFFDDMNL